jgi:arylsulfatase A-like enzyme
VWWTGRERPEIQVLRDSDVTVAEVLKKAGYATALCGKWGLGDEGTIGTPNKQGFDYFIRQHSDRELRELGPLRIKRQLRDKWNCKSGDDAKRRDGGGCPSH